jgi:hypothetical protein
MLSSLSSACFASEKDLRQVRKALALVDLQKRLDNSAFRCWRWQEISPSKICDRKIDSKGGQRNDDDFQRVVHVSGGK